MKKGIIITAIIIVLAFIYVDAYAEVTQTGVGLEVVADRDEVLRTQIVNLSLEASDLNDLYTMQMEIRYDPKMLELDQSYIKNLIWENNQNGYTAIQIDSKIGVVNIIYSRKGKVAGVSGYKNLIGLQFKTLRIGMTTVKFNNLKLVNSQGNIIKTATTSITKEIEILPNPLDIKLTGVKGDNNWFISDVKIEINDLDAEEIYYTLDGIRFIYTQPFSIDTIGRHNLKVTTNDGYGYIKEKEEDIKIDYNCPILTVDNQYADWQNKDLKVMPKYDDEDGSGIMQSCYQWTNTTEQPSDWEEYSQEELVLTAEGHYYLHTKAVDIAGNTSQTVFGPYRIDKTVPVITVDYDKRETWENTDIAISPIFTDAGDSQIKYIGYQWSPRQSEPSEYTPYTSGSLVQTNDGAWYLHLIVEDWAGNKTTNTYGPYKMDKTIPVIDVNLQERDWGYTDISVIPVITDKGGSLIKYMGYQWSTTQAESSEYTPYRTGSSLLQPKEGVWYLHMKAEDWAGNNNTVTYGPYKLDKTIPAITVDVRESDWVNTDISVIPVFTDEGGSKIKYMGYQWSLHQSAPFVYTTYSPGSLMQSKDGVWYLNLIVEDWAGNIKTVTYNPYKIDKSAPIIEFSGVTEGMDYTDTVIPNISIDDTVSGIKAQTIMIDGQVFVSGTPVTEQGTHIITAFAEDFSGNITTKSISFKVYTSTCITLNIPQVEYSDKYTINATLTAQNQAVSGAAIAIRIDGANMGTFYTDSQGNATLNGIALYSVGIYTIDAIYLQDDSAYYRAAQCQSYLSVITEKNSIIYTGSIEAQYPGIMTVSALVNQEDDGYLGDISLARLNVDIIKQNPDGSETLIESLITNCDQDGIVKFDRNYEIGVYKINILLLDDGYYTPSTSCITVPIYQGGKGDVSCGGWLLLTNPSNGKPVKVTCNFNVKFKSGGADGTFKLLYEVAGININNGNITWLVIDGNTAQFQGKDGTYTYRLACIDNKNKDYITLRIWYGTNTAATPILEITNLELSGGNINVKDR